MTYQHWKSLPDTQWFTEPISCTCQVVLRYGRSPSGVVFIAQECGKATEKVYPAMGHGWQALCGLDAVKHKQAFDVYELISDGEKWGM